MAIGMVSRHDEVLFLCTHTFVVLGTEIYVPILLMKRSGVGSVVNSAFNATSSHPVVLKYSLHLWRCASF